MSRVVVVSSYPPRRCGIGAYAAARVVAMRSQGDHVVVVSPRDGAGDVTVREFGGRPFRRAIRAGRGADAIEVHFQPALWYRPRRPLSKVATSASLLWLVLRRRRTRIVVHEADPPRWRLRPDYLLLAMALRRARLVFHTDAERRQLERAYRVKVRSFDLVEHADSVAVHPPASRAAARERLGVDPGLVLFVCAGFIHPDKGFDRAVEAFGLTGPPGNRRLVVVGSVKDRTMANLEYTGRLRDLVERTPGVELRTDYVTDEDFDAWITAADRVVLPYRRSWSSGVLARARRLGTPAIVSAVGGLAEQAGPDDRVFATDEDLVTLLAGDREAAVR